ncbi:UPF0193 protein EVG1-like [Argiope bruennichi]|uniref:UPF0193 protein EVG1 like protein n=1 Tax=Argiope bruennichi TaxID=94029 RepID=A0A8T0F6E9_ARGBR|nr:UPF0193 protein EVG1-like [Argiope bruennichi]KAF8786727.1 UPF0193 protein EVG1 like protein [Argiope bruennichi]
MDFKTARSSSQNGSESSRKASVGCKNILLSLMTEVNMNSKLQNEILHFADNKKPFPYIPKEAIKSKSEEQIPPKNLPKLPSRPLQRMKWKIIESGLYEREQYRPNPSKTRPSKEKERFQNLMAFGKEFEEATTACEKDKDLILKINPSDLFDEILNEIKERRDFLEEMTQLGLGKNYLPEIQCQISMRLKELEKLDKERADKAYQEYGM